MQLCIATTRNSYPWLIASEPSHNKHWCKTTDKNCLLVKEITSSINRIYWRTSWKPLIWYGRGSKYLNRSFEHPSNVIEIFVLWIYIRQRGRRLDGCYFGYRRNPELSRHQSRVPTATFSAVLVSKSVRLCSTLLWNYKITHLACIQRCVVTAKCLLTS